MTDDRTPFRNTNTERANEAQDAAGEPTEAAKALHGDRAAVETNEQPETIDLDSSTKIAKPVDADEA
jgi:hypothetical protein